MLRKSRLFAMALVSLPFLTSCNVYKSFASPGSTAEYIQEAQLCLANGDYACAVAAYGNLPAGDTKNEKLCIVNIARAGLGISDLITVINSGSTGAHLLRDVAQRLLPYTATKEAAALESKTYCPAMAAGNTKNLLQSLSYVMDCSIRIAKTDTLVTGTADGGATSCNSTIAGNANGTISAADVGDATGVLATANGMCDFDVIACKSDITAAGAAAAGLTGALADIASNIGSINSVGAAGTTVLARAAIYSSLQ